MDASFNGFLIYSHIIPAVFGFLSILLIANGIMDRKMEYTIGGVVLFFAAGLLPFLILPYILGI
ncbi:MAG: hypothetical protein ACXVH2_10040 [Methanobacterium sp.]